MIIHMIPNNISNQLLSMRISNPLRMPRRRKNKRTRINDPQPLRPKHLCLGIHNRHLIALLAHHISTTSMMNRAHTPPQMFQDLRVRSHIRARRGLRPDTDGVRNRLPGRADAFYGFDCDALVCVCEQPVCAYYWGDGLVGGGDG